MKILITSVGRRVELVQAFKRAAAKMNIGLTVYGADISNTAPALLFCDETVMTPRISDSGYIPFLKSFCRENGIDALIPTIDTDLLLLAKNREDFGGTTVFVAAPEKVALCRDKRLTAGYFHSLGLLSPEATDNAADYKGGFPAFIKPKDGSSSIFAYKVNSEEELEQYAKQVPDYIIQPYVSGTEYTVDIFCDKNGEPVYITPRIRLAVRAGEVLKTEIAQDKTIIEEMKTLVSDFKPAGAITVQLIKDSEGKNRYIEINPRFGGGAPISMMAGADSALALLKILSGENVGYTENAASDGAVYSRFDQTVRVQ